jgi:hypothetical protein
LSCVFSILFHYFLQHWKFIINWKWIRITSNFLLHDHVNVYYFVMLISWFYHFWNFKCDWSFGHVWKCDMLHSFYCEMLIHWPIDLKFGVMIPNMLIDFWGLVVYFSHFSFLFYAHDCMVWQCVSHNLMSYLCIFISRSIEFCWFWFLAWWLYLTCCMHIKISRIVWVISVLIWNFHSWWSIECIEIAFAITCSWDDFAWCFWLGPF